MKRKHWFTLHSWAGIQFSLLFCFVLITGTFATISNDIDWLFNPAIRSSQSLSPAEINWPQMLNEAKKYCSDCPLLSLESSHDGWINPQTLALDPDGKRFRIFHDGRSGMITGEGDWFNSQRFFREIHRNLMLPSIIGISIVSIMLVPLIVALLSSLSVYKNWYKHFFRQPRFALPIRAKQTETQAKKRKNRKIWGELHKFVGLWSMWFIIVISLTGIWYFAELWGLKASYPPEITKSKLQEQLPVSALTSKRLGELYNIAQISNPKLTIYKILLPTISRPQVSKFQPYIVFQGQEEAMLVRDRGNHIALNVETGEILSSRKATELSMHARISEAADPLHFGTFYDGATRWLWFVFGVLLSGMTISGIYLWVNRVLSQQNIQNAGYMQTIWHAMKWVKWPSIVIISICLVLASYEIYR